MKYRNQIQINQSNCTVISNYKNAYKLAQAQLIEDRTTLELFIQKFPEWEYSLTPKKTNNAPTVIQDMENAGEICNVGPMAAVAGVLADRMQNAMLQHKEVEIAVVENGGEIAIHSSEDIIIGLFVLSNMLKNTLGFKFEGGAPNLGVATSSGQFGHSLSFGDADTVTIFAHNAGVADAAATRICNEVKGSDFEKAILHGLEIIDDLEKVQGAFITRGTFIGKKGTVPSIIRISDGERVSFDEKYRVV